MSKNKIGIIIGTNRNLAFSEQIAEYYQKQLEEKGFETAKINLKDLPVDFAFSALYANAGKNPEFQKIQTVLDELDKIIIIVPEYNGSYPGVVKTWIDGLRHPDSLSFKKIALVGLSSGMLGNAVGLSHLNDVLSYLNANVMGLRIKLGNVSQHFSEGEFTNETYRQFVDKQIKLFIDF
jgi:chromate reductase